MARTRTVPNPDVPNQVQTIKITLRKAPNNSLELTSSHPLPSAALVRTFLPSRIKTLTSPYYYGGISLHNWINNSLGTVATKDWRNAILDASAHMIASSIAVEAERTVVGDGGYLAIGDALFRLTPTAYIHTGQRALSALRRHVSEDAQARATAIISDAQTEADRKALEAQVRVNQITLDGERIRREHAAMNQELIQRPPDWMREANVPICYISENPWDSPANHVLYFGFIVIIHITHWDFMHRVDNISMLCSWPAAAAPSFPVLMWAAYPPSRNINANPTFVDNFVANTVRIDKRFRYLPHMTWRACMQLGDAPAHIRSYGDVANLTYSVERAMSRVNCDSLLCSYPEWHDCVKSFMPPEFQPIIARTGTIHGADISHAIRGGLVPPPGTIPTTIAPEITGDVFYVQDTPVEPADPANLIPAEPGAPTHTPEAEVPEAEVPEAEVPEAEVVEAVIIEPNPDAPEVLNPVTIDPDYDPDYDPDFAAEE